jgi:hypothetical protein
LYVRPLSGGFTDDLSLVKAEGYQNVEPIEKSNPLRFCFNRRISKPN